MSGKEVVRKIGKAINWDLLAKVVVSEEGKRELSSLKRAYDDVASTLETKFTSKMINIDWELYKSKLNPKVVDIFENSYKSLQIPDYVDNLTPDFQKKHAELVAQATEAEEFSKKEVVRLKAELEKVRSQKDSLKTMTVDDYFAKNPEVKAKIDDEIKNHNWGY